MGKPNRRRRGGKPRNVTALREPNGRAQRPTTRAQMEAAAALAAASPEAIAHRARLVGQDNARDARAATAYGRLYLAGMLGAGDGAGARPWGSKDDADRRYAAAEQVDRIWRTWASMAGARRIDPGGPARHGGDVDPAAWARTDALYRSLRRDLGNGLALTLVEAMCVEGIEPLAMDSGGARGYLRPGDLGYGPVVERLHLTLCRALDVMAVSLRIGEQRRAA